MLISLIAQNSSAAPPERLFADLLPWIGLLAIIVVLGGAMAVWIRKRLSNSEHSSAIGYTLEDLRGLRDSGEITEAEFESARSAMIRGISKPDEAE